MPGLAISLVSLAIVFYVANPRDFVEAVRLADYRIVAVGFAITLIWLLVRSLVWRTLLQDQATFKQVFYTINEGYLLNNILPFRLGELARAFLLGRKANLNFWQVFPTIMIERILDLAFAAGLLLCTLPFVVGASWAREAAVVAGLIVAAGLGGMWLIARNREWAIRQFEKLAKRWPLLDRLGGKRLAAFFTGLSVLNDGRLFVKVIVLLTLNWAIAIGQYYILMLAFFPNARFLWGAFSLGVAALGLAVPAAPGSVGTMEASLLGGLALFGLDPSTGLAFALTAHLINYILTGILGAFALAQDGESLSSLYRSVRRIPQDDVPGAAS